MNNIIKITKNAGSKLIQIAKQNDTKSLLFYVKGGGCNGFNYKFKIITDNKYKEVLKKKPVIERNQNVNILIDPKSEYLVKKIYSFNLQLTYIARIRRSSRSRWYR